MINDILHADYNLKPHNTFGIDIETKYFLPYTSEETLLKFLPEINQFDLKTLMIGEGSNLLFMKNFDGIVLYSQIKGIKISKETEEFVWVRAGAGVVWDDFVQWAIDHEFYGTENLSIIPGTVGASPIQNIGAYGVEAKDLIYEAEGINLSSGVKRFFSNEECQFAYRNSIFKQELKGKYAITYVTFKLNKHATFNLSYGNINQLLDGKKPNLKLIRKIICEIRNTKLPDYRILGNAGSFFTNPYITKEKYLKLLKHDPDMPHYPANETEVKIPAAWLIDQCGLKGYIHNRAAVHKDQALVIFNTGNATGEDIAQLAAIIINQVEDNYGITLHPEVNFIE